MTPATRNWLPQNWLPAFANWLPAMAGGSDE